MRGIDVEVGRENMESCHRLKGKWNKGKFILKLSKRKYADKIKLSKKTLKNIDQKEKNELLSGTKVFKNESLCWHYRLLWSRCVKNNFGKNFFALLWVTNGVVKIKLLNDQVRSITHEDHS